MALIYIAAFVYFGAAFWKAGVTYYRVKNDAKRLANRLITKDGSDAEQHIEQFGKPSGAQQTRGAPRRRRKAS